MHRQTKKHEQLTSAAHYKRLKVMTLKLNIYEQVTNAIIAELEKGIIPWNRPWTNGTYAGATFRNSAAYIQSWLKVLKNDHRLIVQAAGKAEQAARFIITGEK